MSLIKEIKENKWGIILGGCLLLIILFLKGIDLLENYLSYILLLPAWIMIYSFLIIHVNPFLNYATAPLSGMVIGHIINIIIKSKKMNVIK